MKTNVQLAVRTSAARVRDVARNVVAAVSTGLLSAAVFAQETDPFDAVMTAQKANVGKYAAALVTLAAVGVGFMIAVKYVKKIPRAA